MNNYPRQTSESLSCEIKIKGILDGRWSDWLGDLALAYDDQNNNTILTGLLPNQAALHGLLNKIRDLGLVLLSFKCSPL